MQRLDSTGTVLGLTPRAAYVHRTAPFHPGDTLIVFTDGITEALDEAGEELRLAGVMEVLRENHGARSTELVASIMEAASAFGDPADDRTVVVVRHNL